MRRALAFAVFAGMLAGCDNMDSQPSYREYQPATLFRNGRVLQEPVAGTVARGDLDRAAEATGKPLLSPVLLERGREQFDIYCSPCHGRTGEGDGTIVARGMPRPPSFHVDRLRNAPDQHVFDVITNGYGVMYSFAARVKPRDRWAIIAYIRALQLSQHAAIDDVPEGKRERLIAERPP